MTTSATKLIAILAAAAGILATNAAFAGGSHNSSHSSSSNSKLTTSSSNFNTINKGNVNPTKVLGKVGTVSSTPNGINVINRNGIDPTKVLGKSGSGGGTIIVSDPGPSKNPGKNDCKKFCWDHCYPYYFGCSYPSYSCYDYCYPSSCYPTYSSCSYNSGSITVLENVESSRTRVAVGSTLMVNGQAFGDKAGGARLRVSGMALPIEVLEWTAAGVKVRLPQVEVTGSTPAEIEVVRGDGSLASKMPVELMASPEQLALSR